MNELRNNNDRKTCDFHLHGKIELCRSTKRYCFVICLSLTERRERKKNTCSHVAFIPSLAKIKQITSIISLFTLNGCNMPFLLPGCLRSALHTRISNKYYYLYLLTMCIFRTRKSNQFKRVYLYTIFRNEVYIAPAKYEWNKLGK